MVRTRMTLALVAALALAACGGGGPPATGTPAPTTGASAPATQAPDAGASAPATVVPGAGASFGTLNVDIGGVKYSYPIRTCVFSGADLGVIAYTDALESNAVALVMPGDGSDPSVSGFIDGQPWVIATDPKGTLSGKSGTFSGIDAVSGKQVKGEFACTN